MHTIDFASEAMVADTSSLLVVVAIVVSGCVFSPIEEAHTSEIMFSLKCARGSVKIPLLRIPSFKFDNYLWKF